MKKIIIYKGSNKGLADYLQNNKIIIKNSFTSMVVKMDKERKSVKTIGTKYSTIEEIEAKLPNPIVNRINKFIHVPDISIQEINKYIDNKHLDEQLKEEVQAAVNKLETVNLRIINNIIEDLKIDDYWQQFVLK